MKLKLTAQMYHVPNSGTQPTM